MVEISENWIERLNVLGRQRKAAFLLIDFEQRKPLLWSEEEYLTDPDLRFAFPCFPDPKLTISLPPPGDLLCGIEFVSEARYRRAFEMVQAGLQRGDSFLTNLTMPNRVELSATLAEVYQYAAAPYRIYLAGQFVCFSPEIFVKIHEQGRISSYPMKGTALDTVAGQAALLESEKEIAEHATIVDLIRNDLSQVAKRVRVDSYRYLDRIQTPRGGLLQTSSAISGELPSDWPSQLGNIIANLLPAGSVSGAPKPATLAIIRAAEEEARGYYCGIALHFDGQSVDSCVLIRYMEPARDGKQMIFRTGGGITALSRWEDEYAELRAKIKIPLLNG